MSVEVDYGRWPQIFIAAGQDAYYDHWWIFDNQHWARMVAFPDSQQSNLQIVEEWFRFDISGTFVAEVHWRNANPNTDLTFSPQAIVAPSRF